VWGAAPAAAVKEFQRVFDLTQDGVVGKATWYRIKSVYNGVKSLSEVTSEGLTISEAQREFPKVLRRGDVGIGVQTVRFYLAFLGFFLPELPRIRISDVFDDELRDAVLTFQSLYGLTVDGTVGRGTWNTLQNVYEQTLQQLPAAYQSFAREVYPGHFLVEGDTGEAVALLQTRLNQLAARDPSLPTLTADGIFGVKTYQALRDFQLANALYVDGVAGKNTIASLNSSSATGKNTARPNTTATPTPNISNDIGTTTKVSAENVIYEYWYSTVRSACRQYPYATVYDYSTGISWQVHMFSYGKHAEAEPLTAADTAKLEQAFGGNTWTPKAVWVIFADGTVRMATTHSMPHEVQHITDNNFPGHLCIHFPRTQAQVTAIGPYAMSHQQTVEKGWAETQAMIAN